MKIFNEYHQKKLRATNIGIQILLVNANSGAPN